jgi:hypothetical protein
LRRELFNAAHIDIQIIGKSLQDAKDQNVQKEFGPIGAVLGAVNAYIGVGCMPISGAIGVGGDNW